MVAPIISNDEVIGVFNLESDELNAYTEDDLQVLLLLASQVAIIAEKAMLHEELVKKKRLETQLEVAREVQLSLFPASDPQLTASTSAPTTSRPKRFLVITTTSRKSMKTNSH
jgi:GAF domain-containing protein